uniref:LplC, putative aldouronate transport system permease protein n=1 Tax=uncultured firmicutes bacterium contig_31 TaxID=1643554 RepID=A0A141GNE0_9FIRM|nr:lplC, putative aldouronate transport system permease protein [uncultured firmicutes bacterium contig_31]
MLTAAIAENNKKKMGMHAQTVFGQTILGIILLLVAATVILPFLYVLVVSFTDPSVYISGTVYFWPKKWSAKAYQLILSGSGFLNALKSTLFITLIGTPLNVLFNAGLGYMLSKPVPGKKFVNKAVMFTMLFGAGMVPTYMNMANLGLINSWWACILPSTCGAWTVMVMKSFFESIPKELEEAATIDGCGQLRIFAVIVLPLSMAMLATFTLFAFVSYWNTYFSAIMYLTSSAKAPLQVYVQKIVLSTTISDVVDLANELSKEVPQEIMRMAAVIVVVLPVVCVYPFLQKYFASGVMVGAVKG